MTTVFCDFHHGGMYHAMEMLFVGRLGYDLYRPIGMEWVPWWRVSELEATRRAYLDTSSPEVWMGDDGFYRWRDNGEELVHKGMTWAQFHEMDIDFILSTHPGHEETYHRLWREHKPQAKLIRVAGNTGETINPAYTHNLMDSTSYFRGQVPNYVAFHQEFPLDVFMDVPPPERLVIRQYLNFFRNHPMFRHWEQHRPLLPEFEWRMHGHQGDDGFLYPVRKIAESMADSTFVWHVKQEGYGFVVHNAFAAGRPVVTRIADYAERTAGAMLTDGETCINLSENVADNVSKIRRYAQAEEHARLCANIRKRFRQLVDFDAEEQDIRAFLANLPEGAV